jgi:Domain of unknown function (DU1801).
MKSKFGLFMEQLDHPMKEEIETVREIVAGADSRLTERIKWNAPSFCLNGDDRITFNLHGKGDSFLLVFHCGAKAKESGSKAPIINDETGLLNWVTGSRATVKFTSKDDIAAKKAALESVIGKWLDVTAQDQRSSAP